MKKSIEKWGDSSNTSLVASLIEGFTTDSFRKPLFYIPFGDSISLNSNATFYYFDSLDADGIVGKKINDDGGLVNVTIDKSYAKTNPVWMTSSATLFVINSVGGDVYGVEWPWRRCYCTIPEKPGSNTESDCDATHVMRKNGDACGLCGRADWTGQMCPPTHCVGC